MRRTVCYSTPQEHIWPLSQQFCIGSDCTPSHPYLIWITPNRMQSEAKQFCISSDCTPSDPYPIWITTNGMQSEAKQFCIGSDCTPSDPYLIWIISDCILSGRIQIWRLMDLMRSDQTQSLFRWDGKHDRVDPFGFESNLTSYDQEHILTRS